MAYRIAGIDVHKKMLAVVVADVEVEGEYEFERRRFGSNPEELQRLSAWLNQQEVEEVVMESTAQYWQQRSIGSRYGEHWNDTGSQSANSEKVQEQCRERCIWRKPSPIVDAKDGRRIFRTLSVW